MRVAPHPAIAELLRAHTAGTLETRIQLVGSNAKRVCACDGTVIWNADAFA